MKAVPLGIVLGLVLASLPALPSPARADEAARVAMEHFFRGKREYDLGHFIKAAAEYEKAYEAKESPQLLYNLGQAYRLAGEHQKALNAYRAYLRNAPDADNRDEVAHFIDALKHALAVQKAATEKPPVGTLPPPAATPPPTVTAPVVVAAAPKPRQPDRHQLALGHKLRIAGIAVGAFGIASLAAGAAFAASTASINRQLNDPSSPMPTYDKSLESRGRTNQALETALFVAGGAALAAGVSCLVLGTQKVKRNRFALAPAVGPTTVGATFAVQF